VKTAVNVAIILALAAAVAFLPGAGTAAELFVWLLAILFWGALAWFVARLYREHRSEIFGLGDRMRGVLYVSIAVLVLTVTATGRLWETPAGLFAWLALVGAAIYGLIAVWRHWRADRAY
jgi:hypothetical protein